MAARCVTGHFSPTCVVHIEHCEGWQLSGHCSSVAEYVLAAQARCPGFDYQQLHVSHFPLLLPQNIRLLSGLISNIKNILKFSISVREVEIYYLMSMNNS